jgi:outer membrane protein TolC
MSAMGKEPLAGVRFCVAVAALVFAAPQPVRADASTAVQRFAALSVADAETVGVAGSPDVGVARAGVDAAGAALAQAQGVNGFSALIGYTTQPQGSDTPVQWQQRLGVYQLQTTLGDVQAYAPLVAQARSALAQAIADELVAERTERLKVVAVYYGAVQARLQRDAKDDALASAEAFEDDVRARYGAGKLPRLDLLRAQVATAKARVDQANAVGADQNATDALAREIGRPVSDLRELADDPSRDDVRVLDPDAAIVRALAFRPEIRSADQALAQARAARAAALRGTIPPVTLAGGYFHGDDGGSIVGGPIFSASVTIPLSGIGAAKVRAQDAAIRAATSHRASVARALAVEVGSAARTASAAVIAHDAAAAEVEVAKSELDLATTEYRGAAASGITVGIARDLYDQAVSDEIAARYAQVEAEATLAAELTP